MHRGEYQHGYILFALCREVMLDDHLYQACKADAASVCKAPEGWHRGGAAPNQPSCLPLLGQEPLPRGRGGGRRGGEEQVGRGEGVVVGCVHRGGREDFEAESRVCPVAAGGGRGLQVKSVDLRDGDFDNDVCVVVDVCVTNGVDDIIV